MLDRKGAIVGGLGAADFKVEIGGKPREIVSVDLVEYAPPSTEAETAAGDPEITTNEPKENGRVVLLVIDQASLSSDARAIIGSAQKWVRSMPAKDLIGLLTFPAPGPSVDFTADHAKVAEALTRVVGVGSTAPPFQQYNISIWEAIRMDSQDMFVRADVIGRECRGNAPLCPTEVEMQTKTMIQDAQAHIQPVLRSLRATMRGLARVPGPKHAVLLSSGWAMNERDASTEMGWVAADAARANVTIHTFTAEMWALAASRSRPSMRSIEDRNLLMNNVEMLASMTGGRSVRLTGQADTAFASLSQGLSGYYRLGVQALPEDLDGKDHRINLKVSRPGASLASYRRVLSGTRPQADTPTDPETALREALKGGPLRTGVDLRATSYVLHATTSARDLRVVAVGDVNRAAPGRAKAVAALYDFDGKPVTAMENTVDVGPDGPGALSVELTAPPGTYVLRVAVLDAEGRIGSLERLVDARWKKTGGIETPGLVLFRSDRTTRSAPRPVFDGVTTADEVTAQLALSGAIADKKPAGRLRGGAGREHRAAGAPHRPHRADHRRHHGGAGDAARVDAAAGSLHAEREDRHRRRLAQPHVHRVRVGHRRAGPDRGRRDGAGRLRCAGRGVGRRRPRARRHAVVRQAALRDVHRPRRGLRDAADRSARGASRHRDGPRGDRAIEGRAVADRQRQGARSPPRRSPRTSSPGSDASRPAISKRRRRRSAPRSRWRPTSRRPSSTSAPAMPPAPRIRRPPARGRWRSSASARRPNCSGWRSKRGCAPTSRRRRWRCSIRPANAGRRTMRSCACRRRSRSPTGGSRKGSISSRRSSSPTSRRCCWR